MSRYFVDAWYFVARIDPRDSHHQAARRLGALIPQTAMITHDAVLTEVLNYFGEDGSRARALAVAAVRHALNDVHSLSIDRPLFLSAVDLYESRPDKEYSLVDCISMAVMRARGITHVLTNDHHFRQEGFTVLADAP